MSVEGGEIKEEVLREGTRHTLTIKPHVCICFQELTSDAELGIDTQS